jgi:hypothetical protein
MLELKKVTEKKEEKQVLNSRPDIGCWPFLCTPVRPQPESSTQD